MQLLGDEVYGRCTEECACCIMSGRRRPPHSGLLPAPDMSLIQGWIYCILLEIC
jgi:hypothetical protein